MCTAPAFVLHTYTAVSCPPLLLSRWRPTVHTPTSSAVWSSGGVLRKQFTTSAPIIKAAWCYFQNTGPDAILCLLHAGALSVYTQDGDSHIIPLPGTFTAMWPLPQGLLLTVRLLLWGGKGGPWLFAAVPAGLFECSHGRVGPSCAPLPLTSIRQPVLMALVPRWRRQCAMYHRSCRAGVQGAVGHGPCILVHPLENIQAVVASPDGGSWDADESVVWSGTEVPFLVTYNKARASLRAAAVRVRWHAGRARWPAC